MLRRSDEANRSVVSGVCAHAHARAPTRGPRFLVAAWLALVLGGWAMMHVLNRSLRITTDATPQGLALLWWTCAKVCAWLLPSAWLVSRHAGATAKHVRASSLRWLGLCSTHRVGTALVWCCAWLAFQEGGLRLGLAPFRRAPADLVPAHLIGALLVAPLFEEVLFRGAMLRALREQGVRRERVVLATALSFAALHLPGWLSHRGLDPTILGAFASVAGFGVVLGYLGWISQSLWAPIMLHFANNVLTTGALLRLFGQ